MKKFLYVSVMFVFYTLLNISPVSANEELSGLSVMPEYTQPNISAGVSFFSNEPTLEDILLDGWSNLDEEIDISSLGISLDDLQYLETAYWDVYYENPEYWYIGNKLRYSYLPDDNIICSVFPIYSETDINEINKYNKELKTATDEILFQITDDMSDVEKILTVHDYMVMHYEYDDTLLNHNITIMTEKTGVCQAYSVAFKYVMKKIGIECTYVSSSALNHMWNLVMANGKWYHIDLTWDDMGDDKHYGQISHEYALLSSSAIMNMEQPHHGFDMRGIEADDDTYSQASWRTGIGSIAHLNNHCYYIEADKLVCSNGSILADNLCGSNGFWDIGGGLGLPDTYAGVGVYDSKLYFNTDTAIFEYDVSTNTIKKIKDVGYVCGFYIDKNILYYNKPEVYEDGEKTFVKFLYSGQIELDEKKSVRIGDCYRDQKNVKVNVFKEDSEPTRIFSSGPDGINVKVITESGFTPVEFEASGSTKVFFLGENLRPLHKIAAVE